MLLNPKTIFLLFFNPAFLGMKTTCVRTRVFHSRKEKDDEHSQSFESTLVSAGTGRGNSTASPLPVPTKDSYQHHGENSSASSQGAGRGDSLPLPVPKNQKGFLIGLLFLGIVLIAFSILIIGFSVLVEMPKEPLTPTQSDNIPEQNNKTELAGTLHGPVNLDMRVDLDKCGAEWYPPKQFPRECWGLELNGR